jgi:glucokinase
MHNRYAGIEIGGTKLQLVLGNGLGDITEKRRLTVQPRLGAVGIREQIARELPLLVGPSGVKAVGVGFGGPVDWKRGRICKSHQVEGWSEFDLAGWLGGIMRVPVVVENDANSAAFGEAMRGAGKGFDPVFYVTLGSGVGGGLVTEGRVYHGATPGEAEIGHVRLDRHGTIVESRCSGWAVDAKVRELAKAVPESMLSGITRKDPGGEARHLPPAVASGETAAVQIVRETAADLAFALSHVTHLFHPEIIVIGGGLSNLGETLLVQVREALPAFLMEAFGRGPKITLAGLGEDAVPVGALLLAATRSGG